jgi:hypothetical protein
MLTGLGKNEWSFVLWLAVSSVIALLAFLPGSLEQGRGRRSEWLGLLGVVMAGSFLGNLISFASGPESYMDGIRLMLSGGGAAGGTWSEKLTHWISFTRQRLPILFPEIVIFLLCGCSLAMRKKPVNFFIALLLALSLGLFSMYFFSLALPMPRYFAPSFMVSLVTLVAVRCLAWDRRCDWVLSLLLMVVLLLSANFLRGRFNAVFRDGFVDSQTSVRQETEGCVPFRDGAGVLGNSDFVWSGMSREGAEAFLQQHGASARKLCL